jgi:outer membrane murein-binding lipoprotein Lpp
MQALVCLSFVWKKLSAMIANMVVGCLVLGGASEREFLEKIRKVKEKSSKIAADVRNDFAKMEKLKADSLKKTEEMRRSADQDLDKLDRDMVKNVDLAPESRQRLTVEMASAKNEIQQRYVELKSRISEAIVPK